MLNLSLIFESFRKFNVKVDFTIIFLIDWHTLGQLLIKSIQVNYILLLRLFLLLFQMLVFAHLVSSFNSVLLAFDLFDLYLDSSQIYIKLFLCSLLVGRMLLWLHIANQLLVREVNGLQRKNPLVLLVDAVQKVDCFLQGFFRLIFLLRDLLVHLGVLFK